MDALLGQAPAYRSQLDETRVIGSLYLLKPLLDKLGLREAVDGVVPSQRDVVGGLTHGQGLEQLIINRLDAPCPLVDIEYWAHERCVEAVYGIPSNKLNDDRVGRALDAISEYTSDIEDVIVLNARCFGTPLPSTLKATMIQAI